MYMMIADACRCGRPGAVCDGGNMWHEEFAHEMAAIHLPCDPEGCNVRGFSCNIRNGFQCAPARRRAATPTQTRGDGARVIPWTTHCPCRLPRQRPALAPPALPASLHQPPSPPSRYATPPLPVLCPSPHPPPPSPSSFPAPRPGPGPSACCTSAAPASPSSTEEGGR